MADIRNEIEKRRTFAIISHPDAGKTTLTEKLLLYGGAIALAGSVKGKKTARHAVSDWMEIEKQRGISVTSSVMQFRYDGYCINILDTPGHQDFSEDTYRTLMAADSAVMVIDASKGVEAQTRKLFKVCAMRGVPIFTFINKMDREARDPYELLEEIENELGIGTFAVNWPIGSGKRFKGVYDRMDDEVIAFEGADFRHEVKAQRLSIDDPILEGLLPEDQYQTLIDDVELLSGAGDEFDLKAVHEGKLSPVFFGSALTNFGVEPFLKKFLQMTPPPTARTADIGVIDPFEDHFSAFVFKIQANMNRAHRDRIAFMRICSGRFEKGMEVYHVQGGKKIKLAQPQQLMAQEREIIDEAYSYIQPIAQYVVVMFAYNLCAALLRAVGNSVMPLVFLVFSSCLNVGLDILFVTRFNMGVAGAAVATVIAQAVSVVLCIFYILKKTEILVPRREHFAYDRGLVKELVGQGLSMGLMSSIVSAGSVILQYGINGLGTLVIAGHTAARKLFALTDMPVMAISMAAATFVSQNRGASQPQRVRQGMRQTFLFCIGTAVVMSLLMLVSARWLVGLVSGSSEPVVLDNGAAYLIWNAPFYSVLGILLATRYALQSLGQKVLPLISSGIEFVGKILFVLFFIPRFEYMAVILCEPIIWCFMCAQLLYVYIRDPFIRSASAAPEKAES